MKIGSQVVVIRHVVQPARLGESLVRQLENQGLRGQHRFDSVHKLPIACMDRAGRRENQPRVTARQIPNASDENERQHGTPQEPAAESVATPDPSIERQSQHEQG